MNIKNIVGNCTTALIIDNSGSNCSDTEILETLCSHYSLFEGNSEFIRLERLDEFFLESDNGTDEFKKAFANVLRDVLAACEENTAFDA